MPDHLDVFWVTRDGGIGSNWWTAAAGASWADHGWFRIAPAGSARPGSALAVVARTPDNLDVYWLTPDGAVASNWWFGAPGASWADHGWFTLTAPGAVAAGGGVTATSRTPNNLDVFWVAPDGSIGTQWWHAAVGHSWADHAPFAIAPAGSAAPGSALASVGRLASHLDVFWVRPDGAIGTQWWDSAPDQGWNHQPFAVTPPGVAAVPPAGAVPGSGGGPSGRAGCGFQRAGRRPGRLAAESRVHPVPGHLRSAAETVERQASSQTGVSGRDRLQLRDRTGCALHRASCGMCGCRCWKPQWCRATMFDTTRR